MLDVTALRERIAFIRAGSETERFHTDRMIYTETVGHHSFNAAWLMHLLTPGMLPEKKLRCIMSVMAHDLAEHIAGDMPAPSKRALGIGKDLADYEDSLLVKVGLPFTVGLAADEARLLKLVDCFDGMFYIVGEMSLGNRRPAYMFTNYRNYISQLEPFGPIEQAVVDYLEELWAKNGGVK